MTARRGQRNSSSNTKNDNKSNNSSNTKNDNNSSNSSDNGII